MSSLIYTGWFFFAIGLFMPDNELSQYFIGIAGGLFLAWWIS